MLNLVTHVEPTKAVLDEKFITDTAVGEQAGKAWVGSHWFTVNVAPKAAAVRQKAWKFEAGKKSKVPPPSLAEFAREVFDKWAFDARQKGLIGTFAWCERLGCGFVEVPNGGLAEGEIQVTMFDSTTPKKIQFLMNDDLLKLSRLMQVYVETCNELTRAEVTRVLENRRTA